MYQFIDVNGISEGSSLPSEALQLNGTYLEHQISGYRTLSVSGREALSPEVSYYETGIRDGSNLQSRRYPARTITVTYRLHAASSEAFREAYNKLGQILNGSQAELIFADEPDKFFIGTLFRMGTVEPGSNSVIGEIEFLCTDPFKYSVLEYEAEASTEEGGILVDYNGSYKSFPVLEAEFFSEEDAEDTALTGSGDCGFVAFFNEREEIIQLGDPGEPDDKTYAKSQTLTNQTFLKEAAWGDAARDLWAVNSGNVLPSGLVKTGSAAMGGASFTSIANTSATLLSGTKTATGSPYFVYKITAKTSSRTEKSVKVNVSVTTALASGDSYFGRPFGLKGSLYIGGAWQDIILKKPDEYWKGKSGHLVSKTLTLTNLKADTAALSGIKFKVTRTDSTGGNSGTLKETACKNLPVSPYVESMPTSYYLCPQSYGAASGKWHGPSLTRTLPADKAGVVGAENFSFTYKQKMAIGSKGTKELGGFQMQLTTANGTNVCGVRIVKSKAGNNASLSLYVGGKAVYTGTMDLSYKNQHFGAGEKSVSTSSITKSGGKVTFRIGKIKKTFSGAGAAKAQKITVMFEQYSTSPSLTHNGLYWVKFVKNNCATYQDIPNKFSANDVLQADCRDGEITLNNSTRPDLGALGNDWEGFYLTPGLNQIGTTYSDWVEQPYAPKFKLRYREVFL